MILKMKKKFTFVFLYFLIFPSINSIGISLLTPTNTIITYPNLSLSGEGVSNYNISESVTYEVVINFTLTHKLGVGNYSFKFARLNNRMPNSSLTPYCPPYQESELNYSRITGNNSLIIFGHHDKFNNTYDSFNALLSVDASITYDMKYYTKLNSIYFQGIDDADIGVYDISDEIFDLYCNNSEDYYERNETSLILQSDNIVSPSDNPVEKAEKIRTWVSNYLVYNGSLPNQEKGALWAYNNQQGDCSEYSSLMVTLLRIQGIPARKVTGFLVSNDPAIRPTAGNSWNFYTSHLASTMLGHAWIEYYVEGIGWIACDALWNYFNTIDFLRFNLNVGANFFFPPSGTVSEFGNPIIGYIGGDSYESNYNVKITVLESNLAPLSTFPIFVIIFIVAGVSVVVIAVILLLRRGSKKEAMYY